MRAPLAADLLLVARVLMSHPREERRRVAEALIRDAETAHRHFETLQRCHPRFGDGSLMAIALTMAPVPEPVASDPDFLHSLGVAASALEAHSGARSPPSQL